MKVLIVGGTGLISSRITPLLLARGDNLTLYNRGRSALPVPPGYQQIVGDRTQGAEFERQMAEAGPFDCVIDMICFEPAEAESDVRAFRGRTEQFIFCSTVDVYTKPAAAYPIHETSERCPRPSFAYAHKKAQCEEIFLAAHAAGELPVTIIRPAATNGEGGRLIHSLGFETFYMDRLRRGLPVIVHGDGTNLWSFCHAEDVARAFVAAAGNPRALGRAYHVTGEEWLTWDGYMRQIAAALGAPPPALVHIPTDVLARALPRRALWCVENFCHINIFDNAAARADLGFDYTISFAENARRTIGWLAEHDAIEPAEAAPWYDALIAAWERLGSELAQAAAGLDA